MNLNYGKDRKRGVDFLAPQFLWNSGLNISSANAARREWRDQDCPKRSSSSSANAFSVVAGLSGRVRS
ncbi:hypothetical protein CXU01_10400 [Akkermansia muciniphila]|nr:hypothetical protein CXU01_10400 [Akkermansia muciniphila]